ncbi:DUF2218 domain-containing protein [Falsihalocynthiibacter arcticus]|uniref:DUF2218 domain-containing protein n=1 Tax=Falsihalocynthiibacter arcticus TaxID=1579316 RepID=UPI0009EE4E28|nr:DUF2218 domain-containing protein [Falsihalocynthiibacter arcticus]
MFTSNAKFTSERASGYLQQLCKHFGHKIEVQFDPKSGPVGSGSAGTLTILS